MKEKGPETEKINLGYVDLGRIDLLVREGFYSNRTGFIQAAIRGQIASHDEIVTRSIERHSVELGLRDDHRHDLEALRKAGEVLHVKVVGLVRIAADIPVDHALQTIGSITVQGALQASVEVKTALAD